MKQVHLYYKKERTLSLILKYHENLKPILMINLRRLLEVLKKVMKFHPEAVILWVILLNMLQTS